MRKVSPDGGKVKSKKSEDRRRKYKVKRYLLKVQNLKKS